MQYNGGKVRTGEKIAEVLNKEEFDVYLEPFCGMLGIMRHIKECIKYASDLDEGLINLHTALRDGWIPPKEVSEELYKDLKSKRGVDPLSTVAKFGCSFGGKPWGGYARSRSSNRNYALNAHNSLLKLLPSIQEVTRFDCADYKQSTLNVIENHSNDRILIVCDPPYLNTTDCGCKSNFDHEEYYDFLRSLPNNVIVYCTEFYMPDDFEEVLQVKAPKGLDRKSITERLFKRG